MAGVKGKSGGARPNAGRKRKDRPYNDALNKIENIEEVYAEMKTCDIAVGDFPKELEGMPYAKEAWDYVLNIDKLSTVHLLNARHKSALVNYCIAVSQQRLALNEWKEAKYRITYENSRHDIVTHTAKKEVIETSKIVNDFAEQLGLTVLGEYKLAKTVKSSPNLTGDGEQSNEDDGMFE